MSENAKAAREGIAIEGFSLRSLMPNVPLPMGMVLIALAIWIGVGTESKDIIAAFNASWGAAIGEFALILIPSFVLAAAMDNQRVEGPPIFSLGLSPIAAAGMVCPDTAYAALSPLSKRRRLSMALGAYAGFKLLFPAGPLIIATSLGVVDGWLLFFCILVFLPIWMVGLAWGAFFDRDEDRADGQQGIAARASLSFLLPFGVLAGLLAIGMMFDMSFNSWIDFATNPKGALILAALTALMMVAPEQRRGCLDSGLRRTGFLLVIIGAASAFSAALALVVPISEFFAGQSGALALFGLFALTAFFKIVQGSSMATFATVGPLAAPIVAAAGVSPVLAVLAICFGSFVAILPNDSFYWLVRQDALVEKGEMSAIGILAGGSLVQATFGIILIFILYGFGVS
ncbi:MAG: hypothetical protein ACR2RF_26015 [Geminicoccaceae bacterium]